MPLYDIVEGPTITVSPMGAAPKRGNAKETYHGKRRKTDYTVRAQVVFGTYHRQREGVSGASEDSLGYVVIAAETLRDMGLTLARGDMIKGLGTLVEAYYLIDDGQPFGDYVDAVTGFAYRMFHFADRKPVS